ncbi:Transposase [Natronococcus jeotgali DSM 18795]|uniref:Transposase n=1 Tax=Natronococcus jeotgali DSM 18795 TaxID=1227498 RepID=L9XE79_9EURY|nr:Transposase [Natronococcus jeotgali DSM 18795]
MEHLDEISVAELYDALDNIKGKKPIQRLLAAIAYKSGVTQIELPSGTTPVDEQSTVGSSDSTLTSRLSRPLLMLIVLGKRESSQKKSNKDSKRLSTNLPKKLG